MTKPTAQELWERINRALETNSICAISLVSKKSTEEEYRKTTSAVFELVKDYSQTYHEEQMRDFVGIPQGEFTVGFMNPKSPGAIYLKTYPTNPKNNEL